MIVPVEGQRRVGSSRGRSKALSAEFGDGRFEFIGSYGQKRGANANSVVDSYYASGRFDRTCRF